jgi:hypothetical protein
VRESARDRVLVCVRICVHVFVRVGVDVGARVFVLVNCVTRDHAHDRALVGGGAGGGGGEFRTRPRRLHVCCTCAELSKRVSSVNRSRTLCPVHVRFKAVMPLHLF